MRRLGDQHLMAELGLKLDGHVHRMSAADGHETVLVPITASRALSDNVHIVAYSGCMMRPPGRSHRPEKQLKGNDLRLHCQVSGGEEHDVACTKMMSASVRNTRKRWCACHHWQGAERLPRQTCLRLHWEGTD